MSDPDPRPRWTAERQCRFLQHLDRYRCAASAAAFVGMSRESAKRLCQWEPDPVALR